MTIEMSDKQIDNRLVIGKKHLELIVAEIYSNAQEHETICTVRDKDGRYPLCNDESVYWGAKTAPIQNFMTEMGVPCCENSDLFVMKIKTTFAVYDDNMNLVTHEYGNMEKLIEEIKEKGLYFFDFEY